MSNKLIALFLIFMLLVPAYSQGQQCNLVIKGQVFDEATEQPLPFANVFIQETANGAVTDDQGQFEINNVCPGSFHLIFTHIGCEEKKILYSILRDTLISVTLSHNTTSLGTVVIESKKDDFSNQPNLSVTRQRIEDNTNQTLSGILSNESGVYTIRNGNAIAKPVIHGLYGNRLTILNNGIVQSGQQWGNDHSPEIDIFASDKLTVLKGASAIEYAGGNFGSIILSEPKSIEREPHLHGQVNYIYETNGRGHTVNTRFEKYSPFVAWRINGTLKQYGDQRSADYFLNNSGFKEANISLQLEKSWNDRLFMDFYASSFNTRLGVLRGSHIGNLTDLNQAFKREVPFFTENEFSYDIDAPRQHVSHHLFKLQTKYYPNEDQVIDVVLSGQINNRKEFDVRRSGRSDIPALSLEQFTFNAEAKYGMRFGNDWQLKIGNQYILTDNSNNPETGILPLIPDYLSWKNGLYSTISNTKDRFFFKFGVRYDYEGQDVRIISPNGPREIVQFDNQFNNISGQLSLKFDLSPKHSLSWNTGFGMRNPAVNELYSAGLHQGVSGIEEGDVNLSTEKALKNTLEYNWYPNTNFTFNALVYHQNFQDYIFLNPQNEVRLTIRGAFPVFKYDQTDAHIYGLDLSTQFTLENNLLGVVKFSYIRGEDIENDIPLIFMPPNSLFTSFTYRIQQDMESTKRFKLEDSEIEVYNRLVFEQTNILPTQDFIPPPGAYNLLGIKMSTNLTFANYSLRCFVKADNLINVRYRDYLNRQRYFADDLGRSITIGMNVKF